MNRRTFPRAACATLVVFFLLGLSFFISPAASSQRRLPRQDVESALESFDELTLDPASLLRDVHKTGRLTLNTSRGAFEMTLQPFDVRTPDYRSVEVEADGTTRELPREPSHAFRGTVSGMSGTQVRLILDAGQFEGIIVTPDENYFVEPEQRLAPAADAGQFIFYAESAVKQKEMGTCATTLAQRVGGEASRLQSGQSNSSALSSSASKGPATADAFSPMPQADVATEADFEFTQTFGGDASATNNDIANIITQVDGIYNAQLGINLRVTFQRAWTANNDPYTLTDSIPALNELADNYDKSFTNAGQTPPARDLVHMFTGKDFNGSTIGISFIGAVCEFPESAFGISQSKFNGAGTTTVQRVALTAHEIGHNFGASHPDEEPDPKPANCSPSIMNSFIQTTNQFCQFSIDQITEHVANFGDATCLTRLAASGCTYTLSSALQTFPTGGGTGSVNLNTSQSSCGWTASEGANWLAVTSAPSGAGSAAVTYTVDPNSNAGPRASAIDIGGQQLKVQQAASTTCPLTPIGPGQTLSGSLDSTDCVSGQPERPKAFADLYTFTARAGQRIRVELNAAVKASDFDNQSTVPDNALDTVLYIFGPNGSIVAFNDDVSANPHNTDSSIPVSGFISLPQTGIYTVEATSFDNADAGSYTIKLTDDSATNTVALSASSYSVNEGVGSDGLGSDGTGLRVINVTRSGNSVSDVSGTATVDYATSNGTADKHGDYEQTLGTLVFAPGQTTQSFTVFVPDDRFAESPETLTVSLSNPVGTTLGSPSTATLTINSNPRDAANNPSPVRWDSNFNTGFFVRQQYLDFFGREPDASGFQFWSSDINNCGADDGCAQVHRINVSAAFFLSIEFQETGYLVERIYKTAFGDATGNSSFGGNHTLAVPAVRLEGFLPDTRRIGENVVVGVGNWQQQLEANKQAFALEFVTRPTFISAYPLTMTPAQFVDKLNQNAGSVLTQPERDALVSQVAANPDVAAGRAAALRAVAENPVLNAAEKNRAFVLMQFFGYLRRNPNDAPDADYTGYDFWLQKLNQFGGDFVQAEMVKAFITSIEYTNRFGA